MRITKYLHSCLLVADQNKTILIDPGNYTYEAGVFDVTKLTTLDHILITHEHADHMSLPLIREVLNKFPEVSIISTPSVVSFLAKEHIQATRTGTEVLSITVAKHEEVFFIPVPENVQFTLFQKLTHPGDSYEISSPAEILAMPMTAPWGSMVASLKKLVELKPKIVIPIHDWHWKDVAIEAFYKRAQEYLKQHDIEFVIMNTGETIER